MSGDNSLLATLFDSWDRNNRILVNLLSVVPPEGMDVRPTPDGHSVAELFTHMNFVRAAFVQENAPEFAGDVPEDEWVHDTDRERIARSLAVSARLVREAVQGRIESGRAMDQLYDHPILLLQHLIWHEGYHHGQIKLALKLAGTPIPDSAAGPASWAVWMRKTV